MLKAVPGADKERPAVPRRLPEGRRGEPAGAREM